jgi:hypothetical protein
MYFSLVAIVTTIDLTNSSDLCLRAALWHPLLARHQMHCCMWHRYTARKSAANTEAVRSPQPRSRPAAATAGADRRMNSQPVRSRRGPGNHAAVHLHRQRPTRSAEPRGHAGPARRCPPRRERRIPIAPHAARRRGYLRLLRSRQPRLALLAARATPRLAPSHKRSGLSPPNLPLRQQHVRPSHLPQALPGAVTRSVVGQVV